MLNKTQLAFCVSQRMLSKTQITLIYSDGIQEVGTGSREPVFGISARLANPLLTLLNLCISISPCLM